MQSTIVTLDVEGKIFKTRLSTLTSVKNSFFYDIFAKNWRNELDKHGNFFIDRDSSIFQVILNYLRDLQATPLPRDEYMLARIMQEARFFRLFGLCDMVERVLHYEELPVRPKKESSGSSRTTNLKVFTKQKKKLVKSESVTYSLPPSPMGPLTSMNLNEGRRSSIDSPPVPQKKSAIEKRNSKKGKLDSISLPRNFAHVAHVGWNGNGVIFKKHLLGEETTVRAIIDAANESDLTPVYNLVDGEDSQYGSHSVEVILAGPHMQAKEVDERKEYSKPMRRPPKTPPKPPSTL